MVRPKSAPKKPTRGVDFKKIKRKIGRKLPPPKNATNTQIKSKAIVLPEQSVASEKEGLAVNKKGLTLRELLQQTSHHNAKIRRVALNGVRDLVLKHPSELKLHRLAIIEKIRERICDNDQVVRETLYQLLKSVIFPSSKEDFMGPVISLMMAYIFNAMTHMAVDIRLMAFQYFELVVLSYPSSFFLYAEKVLDNYIDILKNSRTYLQEKSKLKSALAGLVRCLSLLANEKGEDIRSNELKSEEKRCLHAFESKVSKDNAGMSSVMAKLDELVIVLVNSFQESISLIRGVPVVDALSFDCMICTLQSINLAVTALFHEINVPHKICGISLALLPNRTDGKSAMLVQLSKLWDVFPVGEMHHSTGKGGANYFTLNVVILEIYMQFIKWIHDSLYFSEKFLKFIEGFLLGQVGKNLMSNKTTMEKHLISVISFVPVLVSGVMDVWKIRLLEVFTSAYKSCKVESKMTLTYLSAIEDMLLPIKNPSSVPHESSFADMKQYLIAWIQEIPSFLIRLGDKHPSITKAFLKFQLQIAQFSGPDSYLALECTYLQWPLREFYCTKSIAGEIIYGPFVKLPSDCQELAISSLYYSSILSSDLLESLAHCCLCDVLEPSMVLRIVELLNSTFQAGRVQISDHISFLVTLVARFRVSPDRFLVEKDGKASNFGTFKSVIVAVSSCLSQIGDQSLILSLVYKKISSEMSSNPPLDNIHGLLRVVIMLDIKLVGLSEEHLNDLSTQLCIYLIETASSIFLDDHSHQVHICRHYMQPCIFLFRGNNKLLMNVLKLLGTSTLDYDLGFSLLSSVKYRLVPQRRILAVISLLLYFHDEVKLHGSLCTNKDSIKHIVENIGNFLASSDVAMTVEERHKIQTACNQLKAKACALYGCDKSSLGGV